MFIMKSHQHLYFLAAVWVSFITDGRIALLLYNSSLGRKEVNNSKTNYSLIGEATLFYHLGRKITIIIIGACWRFQGNVGILDSKTSHCSVYSKN